MARRTYGGPLVDMTGAVDLHCHPYPDLFPRLADDFDIVQAARRGGDEGDRPQVPPREHRLSCLSRAAGDAGHQGLRRDRAQLLRRRHQSGSGGGGPPPWRQRGMDAYRRRRLPRRGAWRDRWLRRTERRSQPCRGHMGHRRRGQVAPGGKGSSGTGRASTKPFLAPATCLPGRSWRSSARQGTSGSRRSS